MTGSNGQHEAAPTPCNGSTGAFYLLGELRLGVAWRSLTGRKQRNEDAVGYFMPIGAGLATKGPCAVIADGVSSAEAAAEASRFSVEEFIQDYYDSPDSWGVKTAGQNVLTSVNRTLYGRSQHSQQGGRGHLCTFSALIIKSDQAHIFHAGDSRIYRYRDGELEQLTQDHTIEIAEGQRYLSRALGMDLTLNVDYLETETQPHDLFLLCTDGITDYLSDETLSGLIRQNPDPENLADALANAALEAGSLDNISCMMVRVEHLRVPDLHQVSARLQRLPFPPSLEPGNLIDGYQVLERLFESPRSQLYRVLDTDTGQRLVLKAPSPRYDDDPNYIERFVMEEWVGLRLQSPHVVRVIPQLRPRRFLYYLMEEVEGETLAHWMEHHTGRSPRQAMELVAQIATGLRAFHQRETYHRDLKPGNIMVAENGHVKIIDFGSVQITGIDEIVAPLDRDQILGTVHYTDPNLRFGRGSGERTDLFSLATITYELITGHLPYGQALENTFREEHLERLHYIPADRFDPSVPVWFDRALEKALSPHPGDRQSTMDEFLQDLSEPNPELLEPREHNDNGSLRTSLVFWQALSAVWLVSLIFLIIAFWMMD